VLLWIRSNLKKLPEDVEKNNVFRKRTAEQIIIDGYASGCTDYALVFTVLTRAKGIPTKYVEVIDKKWLENHSPAIKGHVFAECYISENWYQIDPQRGTLYTRKNYSQYEIYAEGLDSWDLGINSFESLKTKFESFRNTHTALLRNTTNPCIRILTRKHKPKSSTLSLTTGFNTNLPSHLFY
jgi:hypothetical protein